MKRKPRSCFTARRVFTLANLIGYWGILPWILVVAAGGIDRLLGLPALPLGVGVGVGIFSLMIGVTTSIWIAVVLYVRGDGFPIALLAPSRLVRNGPYALSRHPLYIAFTIYLLGWGMLARSLGLIAVVLPGFILIWSGYALIHEERVLARRFGEEYINYKAKNPFFLRLSRGNSGPGILFALTYLLGKGLVHVLFPIEVQGHEFVPRTGPAVITSNHACYLDPVFLTAASDRYIRFLTTAEMMRTSLGRFLFTRFGSIPIRRYTSDPKAVRELLSALKDGEIVGIFPEGERSWDGDPQQVAGKVKRFLKRIEAPIIPARIEGSYAILPRWARTPLPGRIKISFLPPLLPSFSGESVSKMLHTIAVRSDGQTILPHRSTGIERLLWACPICHAIGAVSAHGRMIHCGQCGMRWRIDRRLMLHGPNGGSVPLIELTAPLREGDILKGRAELA
ncbi:MAG: 1-acyl-sn-glycerol-3-phosphate acyltransferase, partial [Candidatus Bipolaricaulota bacterium]|nr:1-acyl-sn-glycerol-3-phosphate acyltransferase [Candidatus Bipolaricaulota bacterium]